MGEFEYNSLVYGVEPDTSDFCKFRTLYDSFRTKKFVEVIYYGSVYGVLFFVSIRC